MPKIARTASKSAKFVPYKRGFKPPTEGQKIKALGWAEEENILPEYKPIQEFFPSIPKCVSIDDWLAQVNEDGQTFNEFMKFCPWFPGKRKKECTKTIMDNYPDHAVYVVWIGTGYDMELSPDLSDLAEYAEKFLGVPVKMLEAVNTKFVNNALHWEFNDNGKKIWRKMKHRYNKKTGRLQVCVDSALEELKIIKPKSSFCLVALTLYDLYEAPKDLFVAGMASPKNYVAVFSLFRYDPNKTFSTEFWHEWKESKKYKMEIRKQMILLRSCRLLVHEVSHLLGIDHCIFYACCMNGSGHLAEDFSQPMFLCPVDLRKLQTLVGFDVVERYRNLHSFFVKHKMIDEAFWLERRIEQITTDMK